MQKKKRGNPLLHAVLCCSNLQIKHNVNGNQGFISRKKGLIQNIASVTIQARQKRNNCVAVDTTASLQGTRFLGKCSVCTQAYATLFKDALRPCWGKDEGSVPIQACQCPRGCGDDGGDGETGREERGGGGEGGGDRAQLPPQIEALEPGQRRQRPGRPCANVLSLRVLFLSFARMCVHARTPLQCECLLVAHRAVTL